MFEGPCRDAAAQARVLLMMAAARRWDADWEQCDTQDGFVAFGKKRLRFGEVAAAAALLEPPAEPVYRATSSDPLYGKELTRLDLPAKIDGSANYAGDIRLPDMVFAAIRQGPLGATRLKSVDRKKGLASPGLLNVVTHERWVATVARNWWAANRALDRFAPVFETDGTPISTDRIDKALKAALKGDGYRIVSEGDVGEAMDARKKISAEYAVAPALHAPDRNAHRDRRARSRKFARLGRDAGARAVPRRDCPRDRAGARECHAVPDDGGRLVRCLPRS
jgi:isoquinoline 1-oxidoreductase beta subunit